jgi:hypothetical protein
LSDLFKESTVDISFGDQLRLVSGTQLPDTYRRPELTAAEKFALRWYGGEIGNIAVNDESLYFLYRSSGFVSDRGQTRIGVDFIDAVRAFYGMCLSDGIFLWFESSQYKVKPKVLGLRIDGDAGSVWFGGGG